MSDIVFDDVKWSSADPRIGTGKKARRANARWDD